MVVGNTFSKVRLFLSIKSSLQVAVWMINHMNYEFLISYRPNHQSSTQSQLCSKARKIINKGDPKQIPYKKTVTCGKSQKNLGCGYRHQRDKNQGKIGNGDCNIMHRLSEVLVSCVTIHTIPCW